MKKVCVPRLAVIEKYVSSAGDRTLFWMAAKCGVSQRTNGMSVCRGLYRHNGSLVLSLPAVRKLLEYVRARSRLTMIEAPEASVELVNTWD